MTDHFAEDFVDLSNRRLRPDGRAELPLQHRERGFHVRPLVVVRQELLPVELVKVKHLAPGIAAVLRNAASLERDIRHRADGSGGFHVPLAQIAFVGGDFRYLEPLRGLFQERRELRVVANLPRGYFDASVVSNK